MSNAKYSDIVSDGGYDPRNRPDLTPATPILDMFGADHVMTVSELIEDFELEAPGVDHTIRITKHPVTNFFQCSYSFQNTKTGRPVCGSKFTLTGNPVTMPTLSQHHAAIVELLRIQRPK